MAGRDGPTADGIVLDDVSKAIIEQLQEDGRRPYAAIGKAVGLSEAAVRQRVQRLLDAGVMQIVAVTDPLTVGFPRAGDDRHPRRGRHRGRRRQARPPCRRSTTSSSPPGSFDLLVEVVCEDDDHLLELINKRIRAIPGVRSTESFVYLKLRKQIYTWGTR